VNFTTGLIHSWFKLLKSRVDYPLPPQHFPNVHSNVTNKIVPLIKEWQNRPLQPMYAVVFLDAIPFKVKQDGAIVNKAAYMVIGVDLDGNKDVLGGENESAKFWLSVLNELKNRGIQDILILCVDNLTGFSQAIAACFPKTDIQKCIIHQIRNSTRYVSYKDLKKVTADRQPIYKAPTEEAARLELDRFEEAWGASTRSSSSPGDRMGRSSRRSSPSPQSCVG
jgi:putative transposase